MDMTAFRNVLAALALSVAGGCAAAEPEMADMEDPGDGADNADPLVDTLRQKYGVRPRRYDGLFNDSNEAEKRFKQLLPEATAFINMRAAELGGAFDVNDAELATNFITEGGFFVLDGNQLDGIDGFGALGIDTLVDNYNALKPWLHPMVREAVERGDRTVTRTNELGQQVKTLTNLTMAEGLYANAGMYAWAKSIAAGDLAGKGAPIADLPLEGKFFWSTIYFNAGPGTGRKILNSNGARFFEVKWTKADDAGKFSQSAQFNALWRTASFEYLMKKVFAR
jgi:hypothetical protein